MSKNLSAKYCQKNKERLQKKLVKDIKIFVKKKNKKVRIWLWMLQKSPRRWKNWLSTVKSIIESEKMFYYNYKKVFQFIKLCFSIRESIRKFFNFCLFLKSSFSTNKNIEKKHKKFLIFRLCKLNFEDRFWESNIFKKKFEKDFWKCLL